MNVARNPTGVRLGAIVVPAALVAALAGCSPKHDLTSTARHPTAVSPTRTHASAHVAQPRAPLTKARASAFARSVDLTLADLPGATISAPAKHPERATNEARSCGGSTGASHELAQVQSPSFVRGAGLTREAISSTVTMLSNAGLAQRSVAPADSRKLLACYTRLVRRRLSGERLPGLQLGHIGLSVLPASLPDAKASFGIRISATLSSTRSGLAVRLYLDLLGFTQGAAEISLEATSFVQPEPIRTEQELLALMRARALQEANQL